MSITLLFPYATYANGSVVTLDRATEASLVLQGRATYLSNPGPVFAPLTSVEQQSLRDTLAPVQALASGAVISATQFGLSAASPNNAAALASIAAAAVAASVNGFDSNGAPLTIEFPAGVFYVDGAVMDLTYRGVGAYTPNIKIRGAGKYQTVFRSTASSTAAAVIEMKIGQAVSLLFEDFGIDPRTDIEQDVMHIVAARRTLDNTAGLTDGTFRRVGGRSRKGEGIVFAGGDDYLSPNQFLLFEMCTFQSDFRASLRTMGQFGQCRITGGEYSSTLAGSSAPSVQLTQDLRQCVAPTAVDTTNNFVTSGLEVPGGTPVRIVGTNLPSGLSTGVTYYVRRYDVAQATGGLDRLSLHSSRANVTSNTRIALGSTGTLGNWYISPIYPISVASNAFNFELPHHMVDGVLVTLVGTGLPSGLAVATNYYVIRVDARTIKLAFSRANSLAGTALTFSGGTATTYGISGAGFGALIPYSVVMSGVTIQNSLQALYACGASDIKLNLHVENCKSSIYVYQSQVTIDGGAYANVAQDGGNGVWLSATGYNSRVTICGMPVMSGLTDKTVASSNASIYSTAAGGLCTIGATVTTAKSTGILQQFSAAATLDVGGCDFVFVNTSATQITSISSRFGPRAQVKIVAFSGSIVFASGGNLLLPTSPLTLPQNACAVFELGDTIGTWILVSKSG